MYNTERNRKLDKKETGRKYEEKAAEFLQNNGYKILLCNYLCRHGEIDIIAKDNSYIVFIEVKYRKDCLFGSPLEAVNSVKRNHITKAALDYLVKTFGTEEIPCRFDVVTFNGSNASLIKDAFQAVL